MRRFAPLSVALLLAACGGDGEAGNQTNRTSIKIADAGYVRQLRELDDSARTLTLRRAVLDSGNACHRAEESREIGTYEDLTVFSIRCNRSDWAVFVGPRGDVQVRSCAHVEQLGLPSCAAADAQPTEANSTKS